MLMNYLLLILLKIYFNIQLFLLIIELKMKKIIIKLLIHYYLFRLSFVIFNINTDNNLSELDFYLVDNNFDNDNINFYNNIKNNENKISRYNIFIYFSDIYHFIKLFIYIKM